VLGNRTVIYLTKLEIIQAEKTRRRRIQKLKRLGKAAQDEKDEVDTVNFIYTTLTTEGVPITKEDADLAYKFSGKNIRSIRDENLRVALDMIKGLRYVKDSKKGITLQFLLELHKLIMGAYGEKHPGIFRKKQAYIFLKSYERAEEIKFRPPSSNEVEKRLAALADWYNENVGKLNAIELAAILHMRFYVIHPFEDGNKRMSRLLLNKALFDSGYPILNISKDTHEYFDALINSVEKKVELPFVKFVFERFLLIS
jgi:Fic family protein